MSDIISTMELELLLQQYNVNSDNYRIVEFNGADDVYNAVYTFTYNDPLNEVIKGYNTIKHQFVQNILVETLNKPTTVITFFVIDGTFTIEGYYKTETVSKKLERKLKIKQLLGKNI